MDERKNVVYAVPCGDCGILYFGETGQHFSDRKSQHQRDVKTGKTTNGFFCHVKENAGHKIIKKGIQNLEKGYDLDAIWSEFNGVLRNSIAKKVGRAV